MATAGASVTGAVVAGASFGVAVVAAASVSRSRGGYRSRFGGATSRNLVCGSYSSRSFSWRRGGGGGLSDRSFICGRSSSFNCRSRGSYRSHCGQGNSGRSFISGSFSSRSSYCGNFSSRNSRRGDGGRLGDWSGGGRSFICGSEVAVASVAGAGAATGVVSAWAAAGTSFVRTSVTGV